jgi:hypothetical protein
LSTWAVVWVVPIGVTLSDPDTSPGALGEVRLEAASFRSSGYWRRAGTLGYGLEGPTWLSWCGRVIAQASASSGAHRDVLLPSGGLGHRRSSAGRLRPSLLYPPGRPLFLVGSGAEESTPAVAPLTGRPATTPTFAAPTSA